MSEKKLTMAVHYFNKSYFSTPEEAAENLMPIIVVNLNEKDTDLIESLKDDCKNNPFLANSIKECQEVSVGEKSIEIILDEDDKIKLEKMSVIKIREYTFIQSGSYFVIMVEGGQDYLYYAD